MPVYDQDDEKPVIRPGSIAPSEDDEAPGEKSGEDTGKQKSLNSDEIENREAAAETGASSNIGQEEKSALGIGGSQDKTEGSDGFWKGGKEKVRGRLRATRKNVAAGVTVGVLSVGGLGFFGILQGPLQVMHLAQILQKPFADHEKDTETRMQGLLRFAKSGDFAETRLSYYGSKSVEKTTAKLQEKGVTLTDKNTLGEHKTIRIETTKAQGRPNAETFARQFAAANPSVPPEYIHVDPKGNFVEIREPNGKFMPANVYRAAYKAIQFDALFKDKRLGKITNAVKARPVLIKNGSYSKLHQWKRAESRLLRNAAERAEVRAKKKKERTARAQQRVDNLKSKLGNPKAVGGAVAVTSVQMGVCLAKDIAHEVPLANYENVNMPSRNEALESITMGEQLKSFDDFYIFHPGDAVADLKDSKGGTVWDSKALNGMAKNNGGAGTDFRQETKNSFSHDSPEADAEKAINDNGGSYICSTAGQAVGLGIGIAALVAAAPTGGLSLAGYAAIQVGTGVATVAAIGIIASKAIETLKDEPLPERFTDASFKGSVMAYGSADLAGDFYRKAGGAATGENATTAADPEDELEFKQRSFFARTFDIYDYRSVASRAVDRSNSSPVGNLQNIASTLFNPQKLFSGLLGVFNKKAAAADAGQAYDFGFPKYGFKKSELTNPIFENPYDNAKKAASILDANPGFVERAKKCFGVNLSRGAQGWQVDVVDNPDGDPEKDIVPSSADYVSANCAEGNDNWLRVRLFIFDSRTMEAYACYDGDDEACQAAGVTSGSSASQGAAVSGQGGSKIAAVAEEEYRKNGNKTLETCGENCGPEVQKYTGGPSGPDAPWCAWFVSWVYRTAGYEFKGSPAGADGNIPAVSNLVAWFSQHGILFSPTSKEYNPQPGDVIIYGGSVHTGIVVKVSGDNIETVEGNTSGDGSFNANGETVGRKSFNYKTYNSRSIEFGRLKSF